jgi:nucleoside recognition membrane protein YjiH
MEVGMASALYGALLGVVWVVLTTFVPQPADAIIFWSLICIQLAWGALICWRRTGLPFATAAMIAGSVVSAGLVVVALIGQPFPNLALASWVLFGCVAAVGPLFLLIESRVNPEKWREWKRHMETTTLWEIVTGRHIPDLRKSGA